MLALWEDKHHWQITKQTHQEKRDNTQINKISNKKEVTTNSAEIQRITRDYYEQLYAN